MCTVFPSESYDLLLPARDLWPVISYYTLTNLDHLANEFVTTYSPDYHVVFMQYWDRHKEEMIDPLDENYSADRLPKWVDYAGFKNDMIIRMLDHLIIYLTDQVDFMTEYGSLDEVITVDFSEVIGFALIADNTARDGNVRYAEYLNTNMSVSTADIEKIMAVSDTKR